MESGGQVKWGKNVHRTPRSPESWLCVQNSKKQGFFGVESTRNGATLGGHSFQSFYLIFVSPQPRSQGLCNATGPETKRCRIEALQGLQYTTSGVLVSNKMPKTVRHLGARQCKVFAPKLFFCNNQPQGCATQPVPSFPDVAARRGRS